MKWIEMTKTQKIVYVIGIVCAVAYMVLALLKVCNVWRSPDALTPALFGVFWLLTGSTQKNKALSITHYILAAGWFFTSCLYLGS